MSNQSVFNQQCVALNSTGCEDGTGMYIPPMGLTPLGQKLEPQNQNSSSFLGGYDSNGGVMSYPLAPTSYQNNVGAASTSAEAMVPVGVLLHWQQETFRLKQQLKNGKQKGRGRNQRNHLQNLDDLSNSTAVRLVTRNNVWPKHKFLNIKGDFKHYDTDNPHPFAKYMMRHVTVPCGSTAKEYYEDEVLPEVSACLGQTRNNTVKALKAAFQKLHSTCSPNQLQDSKDMFSAFLSHIDDWSGLADDEDGMKQFPLLIYYFVCEVRGRSKAKAWANQNKQSSVLDFFTPSDVAFAVLIFETYTPAWIEDMELLREAQAASVEQDRPAKRKKVAKKQKMYQKDIILHKKLPYLTTQWNKEGYKRLETLTNGIEQLKKSDIWKECLFAWKDFVRQKRDDDSQVCWVPLFEESVRSDDDYDECEDDDYGEGVEFEEPSEDMIGVPYFDDSFAFVDKQAGGGV